jgi:putative two-component system response regulator
MPKTIFVVDDSDTNLTMAENALEGQYRVMTLPSAEKMFTLLEKIVPDLILLDIEMPEVNGFEALRRLKIHNLYADIPVIFLTAMTEASIEARGFELGAVDFILKPFAVPVLLNRIRTHLHIDSMIRERTERLKRLQNGIVHVFADTIENRDKETGGHIERTATYVRALLLAMMASDVYADEMRDWDLELVASSARLHDVGKIAISDLILNKPGPLTDKEFETMKQHVAEGERIIRQIISRTGEAALLHNAKLFAGYHHEYWDGTGYPHGLKEMAIPLQGRVMAVVDVYDALVSERPYKKAYTNKEALRIIVADAGKQFDPKIVEVFLAVQKQLGE